MFSGDDQPTLLDWFAVHMQGFPSGYTTSQMQAGAKWSHPPRNPEEVVQAEAECRYKQAQAMLKAREKATQGEL